MTARIEIDRILRREGVFAVDRHPSLARTAQRMVTEGCLHACCPGVYTRFQDAAVPEARILAAATWISDGVLTGRAAARLTFWPDLAVPITTVSVPRKLASRPGVRLTRDRLPGELVAEVSGCRVTVPALTALDLVAEVGGEGIDRVLRLRLATLDDMAEALRLTPHRPGNRLRRTLLLDSRDEPWSEAEREGHRLLRAGGITGWRSNVPVWCGSTLYWVDVGFERLKLGLEIDGREVHKAENVAQFCHDRRKWTTLVNHGWTLLHFAASHVFDEPDWFVETVQTARTRAERRASR
jgi:very-short-patch-repair endonuclease